MNVLLAFGLSAALTLALSLVTALLLRVPLGALLVELCGNASRARFWLVLSLIVLVLATLLGMLYAFTPSDEVSWSEFPGMAAVLAALRTSLGFLLSALGGLAFVLLLGIRSFEEKRRVLERRAEPRPEPAGGAPGRT